MKQTTLPKLTGRQKELLALIKDRWVKLGSGSRMFRGDGRYDGCNSLPGQTGC